jgi:hypothetical protein
LDSLKPFGRANHCRSEGEDVFWSVRILLGKRVRRRKQRKEGRKGDGLDQPGSEVKGRGSAKGLLRCMQIGL